eukprot:COSAG05_NODE_7408_length_815_cov_0.844972_1_plen_56_part_00
MVAMVVVVARGRSIGGDSLAAVSAARAEATRHGRQPSTEQEAFVVAVGDSTVFEY